MAPRSDSADRGLLLWLLEHERFRLGAMARALEHESGLLRLAGAPDMRQVLSRAQDDDSAATLALEVYVHRLRAAIASMAVALDGPDVVVLTGGVGERAAWLRARTSAGVSLLGIALDAERNAASDHDEDIGASGAQVRTLRISAHENLEIAREVRRLLSPPPDPVGA